MAAGVQWRVTTGADTHWHGAGQVSDSLAQVDDPYTVTFQGTAGWIAPADVAGIFPEPGGTSVVSVAFLPTHMVLIPSNTFLMGVCRGQGGHAVTLSAFQLDRCPVTVGDYQTFCAASGTTMPTPPSWLWANTNLPMVNVTWAEAAAYAAWMGKRLPTEAEYECAMRDTLTNAIYPWGDEILASNANFGNIVGRPTSAGTYPATTNYGLYDIAGNVWEWCADWYTDVLVGPVTDPTGSAVGSNKVMRGGSWVNSSVKLRCAPRYQAQPSVRYTDLGFRCAMSIEGLMGQSRNSQMNPVACPGILGLRSSSTGIRIDWKGGVEATQYLEVSESLAGTGDQWRVIFTNLPLTATLTNYLDPGATNRMLFYRIRAER